jgi:hypothetical protein
MPLQVQTIACVNNAGFVMSFGLEIIDINTGLNFIVENQDSGNYPIDQTRHIDLSKTGLAEGTLVRPHVRPVWGSTKNGDRFVQYTTITARRPPGM